MCPKYKVHRMCFILTPCTWHKQYGLYVYPLRLNKLPLVEPDTNLTNLSEISREASR